MFSGDERRRVCERLISWAEADERVVQAALVGSLAVDAADAWSDIDLSLGVSAGASLSDVVEDWTQKAATSLAAVKLIDLTVHGTLYRVLLLPGCLQVDLSFSPAEEFRKASPRFASLFGDFKTEAAPQPTAAEPVGWALLYLLAARTYIARGRWWQVLHYLDAARAHALELECAQRELPTSFARGVDDLPDEVLGSFSDTLVGTLDRQELSRALRQIARALQSGASTVAGLPPALGQRIDEFVQQLETDTQ